MVPNLLALVVGEHRGLWFKEEVVRAQLSCHVPTQLPFGNGFLSRALAMVAESLFSPSGLAQLVGHLLESINRHVFQYTTGYEIQDSFEGVPAQHLRLTRFVYAKQILVVAVRLRW